MPLMGRPFTVACSTPKRAVPLSPVNSTSVFSRRCSRSSSVDELADELVHVLDVVGIELVLGRPRLAVGRAHDRAVDVRHRIVEEERLVLVPGDEVHDELVHDVGQVLSFAAGLAACR